MRVDDRGRSGLEGLGILVFGLLAAACGGDGTGPANAPPVITDMTGPARVAIGQLATYVCTAEDPDGDPLFWTWSEGPSRNNRATLTFQNPGTIDLTCSVNDGRGGSDSRSLSVTVTPVG